MKQKKILVNSIETFQNFSLAKKFFHFLVKKKKRKEKKKDDLFNFVSAIFQTKILERIK